MSNLNLVFTAVVPIIVAIVAGALRQDKLSNVVNEIISYSLVLVLSACGAFLDDKLISGNIVTNALIIVAYAAATLQTGMFQALQAWIQSNIFSLGQQVSKTGPGGVPQLDSTALAGMIATELTKNAPAIVALLGGEINNYLNGLVRQRATVPARASQATQAFTPVPAARPASQAPVNTPAAGVMAHHQVETGTPVGSILGVANTPIDQLQTVSTPAIRQG